MSKVNVLIFSAIVGFGFTAGVQIYITWEKIINYAWSCFIKEGANKRGNTSRLTQSFHFFMFEPIFSPVNALNQPI